MKELSIHIENKYQEYRHYIHILKEKHYHDNVDYCIRIDLLWFR